MSRIKPFELFHGAVLTKLVRSDRPITMRLIQTSVNEDWRIYLINTNKGDVRFYMRVGKNPRPHKLTKAISWYFPIQRDESIRIKQLLSEGAVYILLICGNEKLKHTMAICAIAPDKIKDILDLDSNGNSQNVTVKYIKGRSYRVCGAIKNKEVVINQNELDAIFKNLT